MKKKSADYVEGEEGEVLKLRWLTLWMRVSDRTANGEKQIDCSFPFILSIS